MILINLSGPTMISTTLKRPTSKKKRRKIKKEDFQVREPSQDYREIWMTSKISSTQRQKKFQQRIQQRNKNKKRKISHQATLPWTVKKQRRPEPSLKRCLERSLDKKPLKPPTVDMLTKTTKQLFQTGLKKTRREIIDLTST